MTIWKLGFGFDKYLNYLYIIRANAASQKKNSENKIKTTLGPPLLSIKLRDKTPPLTNLRGVRTPGPPSGSAHENGVLIQNKQHADKVVHLSTFSQRIVPDYFKNVLTDVFRSFLNDYLHQNCPNFQGSMNTSGLPDGYP